MSNIIPLNDNVVVEKIGDVEETDTSKIVLVKKFDDKILKGKVVAVSQKLENIEADNIVLFGQAFEKIKVDDKEYLIMNIENVLCKIINQ